LSNIGVIIYPMDKKTKSFSPYSRMDIKVKNTKQTQTANAIIVTTPTTFSSVAQLRVRAIDAERGSYGARVDYAIGLNGIASVAWYDIEANGGKLPENIQAEKDAYYAGLKEIGYSNPSNAWKTIKQYAKANAQQNALFGEVAPIDEDKTKGANANKARPLNLRLIEDLTGLYKACSKAENLSKKEAGAYKCIQEALEALGVNLDMIKA